MSKQQITDSTFFNFYTKILDAKINSNSYPSMLSFVLVLSLTRLSDELKLGWGRFNLYLRYI